MQEVHKSKTVPQKQNGIHRLLSGIHGLKCYNHV